VLGNILVVAVVFAILIFIHELGHLLACKMVGVKVEKFSLGFGPAIVQWKSAETTYMISAVPLGGYIKMEGEDYGSTGFFAAPLGKKVLVMVLGPSFNLILGFVLMAILYAGFGMRVPAPMVKPLPGSPAEIAGMLPGDLVLTMNGDSIRSFYEMDSLLQKPEIAAVTFAVSRRAGGSAQRLNITVLGRQDSLGIDPFYPAVAGGVRKGGAAALAGMQPGDLIVRVDTTAILDWPQFTDIVRPAAGETLKITWLRGSDTITKRIVPRRVDDLTTGQKVGQIGIEQNLPRVMIPFGQAVGQAFVRTGFVVVKTFAILYQLVTGQISARAVSGPVMVGKIVYQGVQTGIEMLLAIWAMLSLNLFVINMLPVPFLDGGRAVLFIYEGVRRKKLTARQWDIALRIGLHLVVMLVILALSNDFLNIFNVSQGNLSKKLQLGMIAAYFIFGVIDVIRTPPAKPPEGPADSAAPSITNDK
jgi:regulator of sigma E protease